MPVPRGHRLAAPGLLRPGATLADSLVAGEELREQQRAAPGIHQNVMKALGEEYRVLKVESLAFFTPIPQMDKIPKIFPKLTKVLNTIDEKISSFYPFNRVGDHIIVTSEYIGK